MLFFYTQPPMEVILNGVNGQNVLQLAVVVCAGNSRTCTNPSPQNGGKTCEEQNLGPARESQKCNTQECGEFLGYLFKSGVKHSN